MKRSGFTGLLFSLQDTLNLIKNGSSSHPNYYLLMHNFVGNNSLFISFFWQSDGRGVIPINPTSFHINP